MRCYLLVCFATTAALAAALLLSSNLLAQAPDAPDRGGANPNSAGGAQPSDTQAGGTQGGRGQGPRFPAPRIPDSVRVELDLPYAATDNPRQRLDLFLPKTSKTDKPLPVVAYIHGGAWKMGDKRGGYGQVAPLVESGEYAGVSIGYRLTGEAIWPAQINDCKAAIRWLRGNAKKYHLDPDRIGVIGGSAGGHLVAMLGTSGDVSALEGNLGEFSGVSSRVSCVVDQFGTTDLLTMGSYHSGPVSPEAKLIGGAPQDNKQKALAASPVTYVSKDNPPFLFIHGTKDPVVPFTQSEELLAALKAVGVSALLIPVTDGGHGMFATPEVPARIHQFFDKHLLGRDVTISTAPIPAGVSPAGGGGGAPNGAGPFRGGGAGPFRSGAGRRPGE